MENEPTPSGINPYQDPELNAQAQDDELLHRLAARHTAAKRLEREPDNPTWQTLFASVDQAVKDRQRQLGIPLPDEADDSPEM